MPISFTNLIAITRSSRSGICGAMALWLEVGGDGALTSCANAFGGFVDELLVTLQRVHCGLARVSVREFLSSVSTTVKAGSGHAANGPRFAAMG
jgi:hypothetical protein